MGGFSIPGSTGDGITWPVDPGTKALMAHLGPGLVALDEQVVNWARREVRRGVNQATHLVVDVAYKAALRELQALQGNLQAQLQLIAALPESIRDRVAYETFAMGFSHYLPKKFLRQYIWGNGAPITLTLQEMIDCNVVIDLRQSAGVAAVVAKAAATPGAPVALQLSTLAGALTNGSLGNFTVNLKGQALVGNAGEWSVTGQMDFYDIWDFDPKPMGKANRSDEGEWKTRLGTLLPGKPFKIFSPSVPFAQTQADRLVSWAGGTPTGVPDRVAIALGLYRAAKGQVVSDGQTVWTAVNP